ncbi:MAG: hypothetical protein JXQ30_04450 [Spirochaetes bacterium]|nr:hypothetical protein [Spirochaetota bacterium]
MKPGSGTIPIRRYAIFAAVFLLLFVSLTAAGEEMIVVYGEYPAASEIKKGRFASKDQPPPAVLLSFDDEEDYTENARLLALQFLSANVYGYKFIYRPASALMKREEVFDIALRGSVDESLVLPLGDGVYGGMYRTKLGLRVTPSIEKWLAAFRSNNLRLTDADGTSDFYAGYSGMDTAYLEALKNLVLVAAKTKLSSKPLLLRGDILVTGNPEFSVGAGRHYCALQGYVNFVEIVTYQ